MVRMQGQGMAGELLPLCGGATQWTGGDNGLMCGSNETPRTGRGGWWLCQDWLDFFFGLFNGGRIFPGVS